MEACLSEILALEPNGERGCFVEVDLVIPLEKHDALNDYPPAPEPALFEPSPLMAALHAELGLSKAREPKLIPNLRDKIKYVVHFRALQKYAQLGCVVLEQAGSQSVRAGRQLALQQARLQRARGRALGRSL